MLSANILDYHDLQIFKYELSIFHSDNPHSKPYVGLFLNFHSTFLIFNTFSLASNESEAEEDEVEKPQRKKRKGRKKAPKESNVRFFLITSDFTN